MEQSVMFLGFGIDAWITIMTLIAVMATLLFTWLRADLVFMGAIGVLFVTGVLDLSEAFSGFTNSSVIIIGIMFVVVTGLTHTGVLLWIVRHVLGQTKGCASAIIRLMMPVAVLSSFIINDSIVILFVRIVKMWSRKLGLQPSKLLIPLSYAAEMGGALLILTLAGGISLGFALQKTGIAGQVANGILSMCGNDSLMVMIAICLTGAVVTEFISNTAAAVLMFPIMYEAVMAMGCDPYPFTIALLLAVNSAFMTPIGTTLNLVVYGPGGYSATDFLRIGLPVKLAYMATAIIILNFI